MYRPAAPTTRDRASVAVTSGPSTGRIDPPSVRPPRELPEGEAPYGFATRVRTLAHRSIAVASRPLQRAEIIDDVLASGMPLPSTYLAQKVSRVLARDGDLVNRRGEGFALTAAALDRELRLIREEERAVTGDMPKEIREAEVDHGQDDVTSGCDGPSLG